MKAQLLKNGLSIILVLLLTSACSKDDNNFKTSGEVNAQKIKNVIATEKPYFTELFEYKWDSFYERFRWETIEYGTVDFEVVGTFIRINNNYYNLEKLHKYTMEGGNLELYLNI